MKRDLSIPRGARIVFALTASLLAPLACDSLTKPYPGLPNSVTAASAVSVAASSSGAGGSTSASSSASGTGGASSSSSSGAGGKGGKGGAGGAPPMCAIDTLKCSDCRGMMCSMEFMACGADMACKAAYATLDACYCAAQKANDQSAEAACQMAFTTTGMLAQTFSTCFDTNCKNECQY